MSVPIAIISKVKFKVCKFFGKKRFVQKVFFRNCAAIRSLFYERRKFVFITSQISQNHPQAVDYKVKCWFCVRPYNHPLVLHIYVFCTEVG